MMIHEKQVITPAYREYLRGLIRIDEDEKKDLRELEIHLSEDSIERIEDLHGTTAFIEGDQA